MEALNAVEVLAQVLEREHDRVVRLWAKQLRSELQEIDIPGRDIRRPLYSLVRELARMLRDVGDEAVRLWPEAVRAHAQMRYDQHFDADDLAREMKVLEQVLLRVYSRKRGRLEPEVAELIAELCGEATATVEASYARILRTEEVRFKEAALMESVLQHVEIGILLVETDGTVSYATPAVGRLMGVPTRAMLGNHGTQPLATVLSQRGATHLDGRPFRVQEMPFSKALKSGEPVRGAWMVLRHHGREVIAEMEATPIREEGHGEKIIGVVQTMTDRTETARQTRELSDAYDELRRLQGRLLQRTRTQALGQLASGAAHALNNFLNVIKLRVTLLRRDPKPEHLDALDRSVKNIGDLVARLQELAAHRAEEVLSVVEVDRSMQEALELVRPELTGDARKIHVETQLQSGAKARVDENLFRELLVNLLFSALDRMPEGGTVRIQTRQAAGFMDLEVEDSGRAYSEEELSLLFDPLKGTSAAPQLSLLLAVGRNHVRRWGGELDRRNRPDQAGAIYRVHLPLAQEELRLKPEPEVRPPPARKLPPIKRVLVVDDDPDNARMMAEVLSEEGYEVAVAHDGQLALSLWEGQPFEAALLDAVMPDMSGWELARELRQRSPQVLLAMVTGADVRGQNRSSLAQVDAVFRKPVDVAALDDFLSQTQVGREANQAAPGA